MVLIRCLFGLYLLYCLCVYSRKYGFVFLDLEQRKMNGLMFVNVCDSVLFHVRQLNVLQCFQETSFFAFRYCHFELSFDLSPRHVAT